MSLHPDFSGKPDMTWNVQDPGDIVTYRNSILGGDFADVEVKVEGTTVGGTLNDTLRVNLPAGYVGNGASSSPATVSQDGIVRAATVSLADGATVLRIKKDNGQNFSASAGTTTVTFKDAFPVRPA